MKTLTTLTPLHQAVVVGDFRSVRELRESEWRFRKDRNGFTPLELAQLLGRRKCRNELPELTDWTVRVYLREESTPRILNAYDFEMLFGVTYWPFPDFKTYEFLEEVIADCPYLLRFEHFLGKNDRMESSYRSEISRGASGQVSIRWIDSVKEYGLFAEEDLPEKSFIGEYTGVVRQYSIDRENPYCFHYPSKIFSGKRYVIDSLIEGSVCRFINHSATPNLQPLWLVDRGVLHLVLIANGSIPKGTELTFHYGSSYSRLN